MKEKQAIEATKKGDGMRAAIYSIIEVVLYSSIFISCCAFFLTVETYLLAGLNISLSMALFIFFATLFTYNLSSVVSIARNRQQTRPKKHTEWSQRNKLMLAAVGIASIIAAAVVFFNHRLQINGWLLLHLVVISVGYTVPVVYKQRQVRPLRSVPLLKVFLIAYVWAIVTTLLPLQDAGMAIWEHEALLLFARRFLFIFALALLFDIRDYNYDRQMKTLTFPGLIGVRNTKLLSLLLLFIYSLLAFQTTAGILLITLWISALVAALVVVFSSENKPRIYYALLADGAMLVHAGLVYLAFI